MNNIIKTDSIDNINTELKLHILELNIAFAKKTASYPKYPETYGNIVEEMKPGNYVIYGSLPRDTNNITYLQLLKFANCFVDKNGYVIKNRWGDDDAIGR